MQLLITIFIFWLCYPLVKPLFTKIIFPVISFIPTMLVSYINFLPKFYSFMFSSAGKTGRAMVESGDKVKPRLIVLSILGSIIGFLFLVA